MNFRSEDISQNDQDRPKHFVIKPFESEKIDITV
jgi:hypothetical protein